MNWEFDEILETIVGFFLVLAIGLALFGFDVDFFMQILINGLIAIVVALMVFAFLGRIIELV